MCWISVDRAGDLRWKRLGYDLISWLVWKITRGGRVLEHQAQGLYYEILLRPRVLSQRAERGTVDVFWLDIGISDWRFPMTEIVADDRGQEIIVGRHLLSKLVLTLDGPAQHLDVLVETNVIWGEQD